jgi:hypothetical protein
LPELIKRHDEAQGDQQHGDRQFEGDGDGSSTYQD